MNTHTAAHHTAPTWLRAVLVVLVALPSAAASSDTFSIRHERSKVRHSTEKEHTLWALHNASAHTYDTATMLGADNVTSGIFRGEPTSASGTKVLLFGGGDDTAGWLQSPVNATGPGEQVLAATADTTILATPTPHASVTLVPVTHKIRKLHKKQIIESRRKSSGGADRGRHRSLAEAEHIAGRQVAAATTPAAKRGRSQLEEVLQLADELDADGEEDDDEEYLNDEPPQLPDEISSTLLAPPEGNEPRAAANDTHSPFVGSQSDFGSAQSAAAAKSWLTDGAVEAATPKDYGPAEDTTNASLADGVETTTRGWADSREADAKLEGLGPNQLASTSVRGITADRQQQSGEVSPFEGGDDNQSQGDIDDDDVTMDDAFIGENKPSGFPLSIGDEESEELEADGQSHTDSPGLIVSPDSEDEINPFLAGVVDAANEDEIYDWDEISRLNRRNLMRGRDVVTKFLQIVEEQHSLGAECEAGTSLNLGVGVVDRYAQDRFRVEAEVAVNRANMLTRIFKMTAHAVQADLNLLHASVLSMVEFDDDIFAAGHCFDWNEHPSQAGLFCPFAYRLPPPHLGAIFAKDLATEYHYLGNTSEWFFQARKNAEKVIAHNEQYLKAFHLYSNKTDERIEDDTLAVKYEDGRWSKPYYDCGGGNIWMLTYTVPFFGYENGTYHFKGTSGIDIDLRRVDIDQCPQRNTPGTTQPLNIFAGTDKCKQRTTMCEALKGLGFRRGSYKCVCRKGYYFPDTKSTQKFFNGSLLEEEYEKLMQGNNSTYNIVNEYECLPCAEGCDSCEDGSPCIAALNWPMRTSILVLACTVIGLLPPAAWFTFRYQQVKVVRAASPALLRVIALGAFFIYCTNIVMYPNPNLYTCTARIWLREIGFSLTYGALMLKTWRISVIFRVRSAKAVKITDAALLKRLGIICGVIGTCLLVRTLVSPPDVVVGRTADDLKAFLCKTDWWDYTFTSMEVFFLAWGVRLCIMVRKAPSEFNESRFISMAIYNEFLLTCFLNVSMIFLQSPANPDLLYIIFFCHTQLTVTLLLALIFGSKVYIVLRSGKSHQENIGMSAKASGAKFNFRPQVRTFANPSSITTSTVPMAGTTSAETKLSDQEALEEIRQLSKQLQRIQEMAPPKGVAVMTISSLLDGLKTPGGMMMVAAAATQAINAPTPTPNQLTVRHSSATPQGALPLLALNQEMHMYAAQQQQNNNKVPVSRVATDDKAVNTDDCGHIICSRCLAESRRRLGEGVTTTATSCQQLGSPPPEGSISFANIKLECMCSQPDLDVYVADDPGTRETPHARRLQLRSAATNTPPELRQRRSGKRTKKASGGDEAAAREPVVSYQICDKCKKKYGAKQAKAAGKRRKKCDSLSEAHKGAAMTCSSDMVGACSSADKRTHSSDDIIFYTTGSSDSGGDNSSSSDGDEEFRASEGEDVRSGGGASPARGKPNDEAKRPAAEGTLQSSAVEKDNDDRPGPSGCPARPLPPLPQEPEEDVAAAATTSTGKSNGSGNGGSGNGTRPKRPDKLVLDLNDRSKYTKEVSV